MKKSKYLPALFLILTLSLSACTSSSESENPTDETTTLSDITAATEAPQDLKDTESSSYFVPSFTIANYVIDWDKCAIDTEDQLTDPGFFPYVKDVYFKVDEDEQLITMTAVLADSTSPDIALDFADTMIRLFNLSAQIQDSSVKSSSKDYYGGIYDDYDILIGIAPESKASSDASEWYIYDAIIRGMHTKQKPELQ